MPPERVFLGTDRPPVLAAADWLLENAEGEPGNLGDVWVGVPGSRAADRLTELLVQEAAGRSCRLRPPRILTAEVLANRLVPDDRPVVPQPLRLLAWIRALEDTKRQDLAALVPQPPEPGDGAAWAALGEKIESLHTDLAASGLRFEDIPARAERLEDFDDENRWQCLAQVYRRYLAVLEEWGHADPQEARLKALESGAREFSGRVVLVGMTDLSPVLEGLLERCGARCFVLVAAELSAADTFDAWGRPRRECWSRAVPALSEEHIQVVEEPADQADAVGHALARLQAQVSAEDITIGLADGELGGVIRQHLASAGLTVHDAQARTLEQAGPVRLLEAVATLLEERRIEALHGLLRHPDIERWLHSSGEAAAHGKLLEELDRHRLRHLPVFWESGASWPEKIEPFLRRVEDWLSPLGAGGQLAPHAWAERLPGVLAKIYGDRVLDRSKPSESETAEGLEALALAVESWKSAVADGENTIRLSASQAIRLWTRSLAGRPPQIPRPGGAIEMLRWIELPLDDAPVLIVAGMNEGAVPRTHGADPFLPDRLRRVLGLPDSEDRQARDAHALSVLLSSRRTVVFLAGRRGLDGKPRLPSRLLLGDSPRLIAERVLRFFPENQPRRVNRMDRRLRSLQRERFTDPARWPPRPTLSAAGIEPLPVTAFRDYLACPYRFYLRHVLKLKPVEDPPPEMDAGAFGGLAHDVLADFGRHAGRDSEDSAEIAGFFSQRLDEHFLNQYGLQPSPALQVQREQLRRRLTALAAWQAKWAAEGWRIRAVEEQIAAAELPGLDPPLEICGRIDRIDFNARQQRWAVLDYKTGDRGRDPDQVHRARGEWVDLQLPLYRRLAAERGWARGGEVHLGYIVLGADPEDSGVRLAPWTEAELDSADERANEVGRAIRAGVFFPPSPPPRFDDYAAICGSEQFLELGPVEGPDEEGGLS